MDGNKMYNRIQTFLKNLYAALTNREAFVYAVNYRLPGYHFFDTKHVTGCIINNSFILPVNQCNCVLSQVFNDYNYLDIRETDTVLDVGANVGIFSLNIKDKVKKVYAVEPLFLKELSENLKINKAENITVLPYALSSEKSLTVEFNNRQNTVIGKTLKELITLAGGKIDFLKCDCEGGEWSITPDELRGIRRVEMELHGFHNEPLHDYLEMLKTAGYRISTDVVNKQVILVHGFKN